MNWTEFSVKPPQWLEDGAVVLSGEPEGGGAVQPREEVILGCQNDLLQCLRGGHLEDGDRLFTMGHGSKTTGKS